jgi:hypothetical protein
LHYQEWLLNADNNNDFSSVFTANTEVVVSYGIAGTTNIWTVSSNQIPFYDYNFSTSVVSTLNSRPLAGSDFSSGQTTAAVGRTYAFGSNIGYSSGSCGLGYWPPGTAVCPYATSVSVSFSLKPATEVSAGKEDISCTCMRWD